MESPRAQSARPPARPPAPPDPTAERARRRGLLGCLAALVLPGVVGGALLALADVSTAIGVAALTFAGTALWAGIELTRAGEAGAGPVTWSLTPLSAAVVASADVLAFGGDLFGAVTWLLLALPCALLGGAVVFLAELGECRRPVVAGLKAAVAALLIALPLPVGGLLGAGASLGHRLLYRP